MNSSEILSVIKDQLLRPAIGAGIVVAYEKFINDSPISLSWDNNVIKTAVLVATSIGVSDMVSDKVDNMFFSKIENKTAKSVERILLEPVITGLVFTGGEMLIYGMTPDRSNIARAFLYAAVPDLVSNYAMVPLQKLAAGQNPFDA